MSVLSFLTRTNVLHEAGIVLMYGESNMFYPRGLKTSIWYTKNSMYIKYNPPKEIGKAMKLTLSQIVDRNRPTLHICITLRPNKL